MKVKMAYKDGDVMAYDIEETSPVPIDPLKTKMYTVVLDYGATGEGTTLCVMYTRGYGPHDDRAKNALLNFSEKFGSYYAMGAVVYSGMVFDFPRSALLVSETLKTTLMDFVRDAGGLEYSASIHYNFS